MSGKMLYLANITARAVFPLLLSFSLAFLFFHQSNHAVVCTLLKLVNWCGISVVDQVSRKWVVFYFLRFVSITNVSTKQTIYIVQKCVLNTICFREWVRFPNHYSSKLVSKVGWNSRHDLVTLILVTFDREICPVGFWCYMMHQYTIWSQPHHI